MSATNPPTRPSLSSSSSSSSSSLSLPPWLQSLYDWLGNGFHVPFVVALLLWESLVCWLIIEKVAYTEIDWKAYMQEVEGWWIEGKTDYLEIRGDTGPLVYPAGFLYIFTLLRAVTLDGTDIRTAQYIFAGLYVASAAVVLSIYTITSTRLAAAAARRSTSTASPATIIWFWRIAMITTCLSKRYHSIFVLRLFNDVVAMLFCHVAMLSFMNQSWRWGCFWFSWGVSVKMNVLLFAPGLLLLLIQSSPTWTEVVMVRLGICGIWQVILGAPFLFTHPVSYLVKAFELNRVFFYQWTVNWKFLPQDVFASKSLALSLLGLHVGFLLVLFVGKWPRVSYSPTKKLSPHYIAYTLWVSNFVGIVFARTLHYQFYSWYFPSLAFLLWTTMTNHNWWGVVGRLALLGAMEFAFLVFPATFTSSLTLQVAHVLCFVLLLSSKVPAPHDNDEEKEKEKEKEDDPEKLESKQKQVKVRTTTTKTSTKTKKRTTKKEE